jgi:hypothetical protein
MAKMAETIRAWSNIVLGASSGKESLSGSLCLEELAELISCEEAMLLSE